MTLIGVYVSEAASFIFADTLVTGTAGGDGRIALPSGRDDSQAAGLARKLFNLNKNIAMAFCGSGSLALTIAERLSVAFADQDPELGEVTDYIMNDFSDLISDITILFLEARGDVDNDGIAQAECCVAWIGKYIVNVPVFDGRFLIAGSGAEHFAEEMRRYGYNDGVEAFADFGALGSQQEALRIISTAQTLLLREYEDGNNLSHSYGGFVDLKRMAIKEGEVVIADEISHGLVTFILYATNSGKYWRILDHVYTVAYDKGMMIGKRVSLEPAERKVRSFTMYTIFDPVTKPDFSRAGRISMRFQAPLEWRYQVYFKQNTLFDSCTDQYMGFNGRIEIGSTLLISDEMIDLIMRTAISSGSVEPAPATALS